jgi:glycosyltransferase involved in cell wall biosynthesis
MTVYIVDIEAVDTRYTKQWKTHLPEQLKRATNEEVVVISGGETPQATTPGAFLNFGGTNVYKSNQLAQIGEMFCNGEVKDGDYFLYTDAWNPTVIQLKYMASLLNVDIKIGGMWHAGSYDPQDFLGRLIGDAPWVRSAEHSMFSCYDHNFYATDFHIDLFTEEFFDWNSDELREANSSVVQVGWPMEYLETALGPYRGMTKENIVLFPHRIAPEKQLDIFKDLEKQLPEYKFVVAQEQELSKHDYHMLLAKSKVVFSANLQETLGISWYEGALVDTIPMVPDRLSYSEMADGSFLYPSEWTKDYASYEHFKEYVVLAIKDYIENYDTYIPSLERQKEKLESFFTGDKLYDAIKNR